MGYCSERERDGEREYVCLCVCQKLVHLLLEQIWVVFQTPEWEAFALLGCLHWFHCVRKDQSLSIAILIFVFSLISVSVVNC